MLNSYGKYSRIKPRFFFMVSSHLTQKRQSFLLQTPAIKPPVAVPPRVGCFVESVVPR
jgi:hypothetical protein